ncbi:MAG TPA: hypothetical protein VIM11_25275 [Tepidisphaeraceae bacterium]
MSINVARTFAVLWLISLLGMLTVGAASGITGTWRDHVSSLAPMRDDEVAYTEHGQTRFAPARLMTLSHRMHVVALVIAVCLGLNTLAVAIAAPTSDATGRRWQILRRIAHLRPNQILDLAANTQCPPRRLSGSEGSDQVSPIQRH